jgi:hypothetical protein
MTDYGSRVASKRGRHLRRLRLTTSPASPAAALGRFDHWMAGGGDANALPERDVSQWAQLVRHHPAGLC